MLTETVHSEEVPYGYDVASCKAYVPLNNPYLPPEFEEVYLKEPFTRFYQEISPDVGGSKQTWKDFENYKIQSSIPSMCSSVVLHNTDFGYQPSYIAEHHDPFYGLPSNSYFGPLGRFNAELPSMIARSATGFVPSPSDLDGLVQRAIRSMIPDIKAKLSLVNSTIELKDFVSLPKSIDSTFAIFNKIVNIFSAKYVSKTLKQIVRELVRSSSDNYLQLKFNVQPLISDIYGVYSAVNTLERRINDLVAREGRVQRRHFSFRWKEFPDVPIDSRLVNNCAVANPWQGHKYNWFTTAERQVINSSSIFHAEMKYNFNFTSYQREHARVLLLLDSLGINLNPQIIWNAIPWSFVVDWVLGVSQWLGQFKVLNMEPQINIIDFLWSVKRQRSIYISTKVGNAVDSWTFAQPSKKLVCVVNETSYRRQVGYPSYSSILSSGLSPTEFSLGAALILSQRRRHK
jgi:hypothetical protein